jgi:hypothetical protein
MLWQVRPGFVLSPRAALDGASGGGAGTARQVAVVSMFGLVAINSGSTQRQDALPGLAVNEGT